MAEIIQQDSGRKKGGKRRPKKHSTNIDMTPMVDLMCLLITFFMLTTAFSKPKVMEIVLPEKNKNPEDTKNAPQIPKERTLNILMTGNDKVYWYIGIASEKEVPKLNKTDYSDNGVRKILLDKNIALYKQIDEFNTKILKGELQIVKDSITAEIKKLKTADKVGPIVLIKADENATYRNVVDIIDEMAITNIARYSIVDPTPFELELLKTAQ